MTFRPRDLASLTTAPEEWHRWNMANLMTTTHAERYGEVYPLLAEANPDAAADVLMEAANTLAVYSLRSAMIDTFTPPAARECLRRYADAILKETGR